jgi:DNA replication protein DnaC
MRCEFIDRREAVILIGNPGTGKTHLATALAAEACRRGKRVRFWRVTELVTQLLEAREERLLLRLKAQLARLDLLVLDELGYVPTSKVGAELLFDAISTAYERGSVLLTSNLPFSGWEAIVKDPMTTAAAIDRLVHHGVIIELNLPSYRAEQARKAKPGRTAAAEAAAPA